MEYLLEFFSGDRVCIEGSCRGWSHSGRWNALGSLLYMLLKKNSASFAVKVGEMLSSSLTSICAAKRQKDLAHHPRAFSASNLALHFALTRDSLLCSLSSLWNSLATVSIVLWSRPSFHALRKAFLASFFCFVRLWSRLCCSLRLRLGLRTVFFHVPNFSAK